MKEKSRAEKFRGIRNNFIIAMSLAIVLGLGWGLGLLATSSDLLEVTVLFQVLFSIFVGMQGVLIFSLHGVRNKDARELWKQCLFTVARKSRSTYFVSSNRTAHSTPILTYCLFSNLASNEYWACMASLSSDKYTYLITVAGGL